MFKTASLLEGCDKAPESWMTTICQLGIIIISFPYSIIPHLMSLFLVPKLPVGFCFFFFLFITSNSIFLILMTFHCWDCSSECQHCFPQSKVVRREGQRKKREGRKEGVREGKDVSITQKDPEVQDAMTPTVGSMINALIYIQLPLDSFRKLW